MKIKYSLRLSAFSVKKKFKFLVSFVTLLCQSMNFCKCLIWQVINFLLYPFMLPLIVPFHALLYNTTY